MAYPTIAVFDIGNVLVRWDPRNLYQKIFTDPAQTDFFLREVCPPGWNLEQDRGRPWEDGIAEAIRRHPGFSEQIQAFRLRWQETLGGAISDNVRCLERLRANGVPTYAITNFAADTFIEAQGLFPFLKGFDGMIVSGREKLLKPDPAIYRLLLDRYNLKAGDCVFIDDSAHNIEAAAALGFATIHYGLGLDAAGAFRQLGLPVD